MHTYIYIYICVCVFEVLLGLALEVDAGEAHAPERGLHPISLSLKGGSETTNHLIITFEPLVYVTFVVRNLRVASTTLFLGSDRPSRSRAESWS